MSFWPLCCKNPQAYPITRETLLLEGQFPVRYPDALLSPAGRPPLADSLGVAGSRSGRVVDNPVKWKSLCNAAGVSEDGHLYVWGGAAAEAAKYRNSPATALQRIHDSPLSFYWNLGFNGLFKIGDDSDWKSVSSPPGGSSANASMILAIKNDGTLWAIGDWQSGVDCEWGVEPSDLYTGDSVVTVKQIAPSAFRAILSSPIASIKTDFTRRSSAESYFFGLPVWFTSDPSEDAVVQKLRIRHKQNAYGITADVDASAGEPGSGAEVSAKFRAKINDGAIIGGTASGSGFTPRGAFSVSVKGHNGSGEGAVVWAIAGESGSLESLLVLNPGSGYRNPVTATVDYFTSGSVSIDATLSVRVSSPGSGYKTVPKIVVKPHPDDDQDASGAVIEVTKMSKCGIGSFSVLSGGTGYSEATAKEMRTGATARAVVNADGVITGWMLTSAGASVYSPLDDEPLLVEVTGDGEGAQAEAVPAGSSIEEVELTSNPEVWTRKPLVEVTGGGGSGAQIVIDGIIGQVSIAVEGGGTGYTKTSYFAAARSHYCPCVTLAATHAVGGRRIAGRVIVGEAVLDPSEISEVKKDASEYVNPYESPYWRSSGPLLQIYYTSPEDTLKRFRLAESRLAVSSQGAVNAFECIVNASNAMGLFMMQDADRDECVAETFKAYIRGPGQSRHLADVEVDPEGNTFFSSGRLKISVPSPIPMPQPPSLTVEVSARPHKERLTASETVIVGGQNGTACYTSSINTPPSPADPVPNAKEWWAKQYNGASVGDPTAAHFAAGDVTVSGRLGSRTHYKVVNGFPLPDTYEYESGPWPAPFTNEPTATISGLNEYRGPLLEQTFSDPVVSWSQPSEPQRIHFVYPTECDFSARAIAYAEMNSSAGHPTIGQITVAENGKYTEEPEPRIIVASDPVPVNTGLTGCTSAGFGMNGEVFAHTSDGLMWWGTNAAIVSNVADPVFGINDDVEDEDDAREVYEQGLKTAGIRRANFTAKPAKAAGHLRIETTGELVGSTSDILRDWHRAPRPQYGNRAARLDGLGGWSYSYPFQVSHGLGHTAALSPGTQQTDEGLLRYMAWAAPQLDHGIGYEGQASIEYRGPGLSPHTFAFQPQVIANGIAAVGKNGLLKDFSGKWRTPPVKTYPDAIFSDQPTRPLKLRTVRIKNVPRGLRCGQAGQEWSAESYTVTETQTLQIKKYIAAVRSAGTGYRLPGQSVNYLQFGAGAGMLKVYGTEVGVRLVLGAIENGIEQRLERTTAANQSLYELITGFPRSSVATTSSYGGFVEPAVVEWSSDEQPGMAEVLGGGTGASFDIIEYPSQRPDLFSLFCLDADINSSIEPVYFGNDLTVPRFVDRRSGFAVTNSGVAKVVTGRRLLFAPEAFSELPPLSGISGLLHDLPFPYDDEWTSGCVLSVARDVNGTLWIVRFGYYINFYKTVHLMPSLGVEPAKPIAAAPLAIALTDTGEGYDFPVSVSVTQPTGVASGSVSIDGKVVGVSVVDGGSGYESPPAISVGGISGQAEIAGPVWRVNVDNGGTGYRCPPKVRFATGGRPATAVAFVQDGMVTSVQVEDGGEYAQAPQVFFDPDKDIERIEIASGGSGYSTVPSVTIIGGGGSGAAASAKISCSVTEFVLTSGGSGYSVTPTVEIIASGAGAGANGRAVIDTATGRVVRVEVTSPGSGYETPPKVRIVSQGGQGGGASAIAKIEGFVSEVSLIARGSGYDEPPKVIVSGGGGVGASATAVIAAVGSGAAATARINGSIVSVTAAGGSGLQKPPVVTCTRNQAPPDGPPKTDAVLKSIILGRPTSVSVTDGGSDYCSPYYSDQVIGQGPQTENKRRTPSRSVRRTMVYGKGSFCLNTHGYSRFGIAGASGFGVFPTTKTGFSESRYAYRGTQLTSWLNTFPFLGVASISGETKDSGGSVSSVSLPKFVVRLRVTNQGSGYPPNSYVRITFKGGGVRDSRFRVFWENENRPPEPAVESLLSAARAYVNSDGKVTSVVYTGDYFGYSTAEYFGFPAGFVAYTSPPAFEVSSTSGSGATIVAELDHPMECYHAPQALFDGHIEAECDMALTLAGAVVEGSAELPCACVGRGQQNPIWLGKLDASRIDSTKLFQDAVVSGSGSYENDVPPPVQLSLTGKLSGYSPVKRFSDWTDEDKEYFEKPVAFFSPSSPPQIVVEDSSGSGVALTPAVLPPSGAVTVKWLGESRITNSGQDYTLGAIIKLRGGVPLARVHPASATAAVSGSGRVRSVSLASGGKGYTKPPAVFIVGDGSGAEAVADPSGIDPETGELKWLRLLSGGSGYTTAEVVIVDREAVAEESDEVKQMLSFVNDRYSAVLTQARVKRAKVPPQRRRQMTTVGVRQITHTSGAVNEVSPFLYQYAMDDQYSEAGRYYRDWITPELAAAGYRLHPVFLSDGYCEYARVEHHFGHSPASNPSVTISATSEVEPSTPATAIAVIPKVGPLFSGTVAEVTTGGRDFQPTQFD